MCPLYICTPVDTFRLCEEGLFWKDLRASPSQDGLAKRSGTERRVFSPQAAVLCQGGVWCCAKTLCPGGRAATQTGLFLCQLLTQPRPDHCLSGLFIHLLRHSFNTSNLSLFLSWIHYTSFARLKTILASHCEESGQVICLLGMDWSKTSVVTFPLVIFSEYRVLWCRGPD